MRTKSLLLGSVSTLAASTAATGIVHAASGDAVAAPQGYTFSVEGGALFSGVDPSLQNIADDKAGSGFDPTLNNMSDDLGYHAAITVGKKFDNVWDVQFGASVNKLIDNAGSVTFSGGSSFFGSSISVGDNANNSFFGGGSGFSGFTFIGSGDGNVGYNVQHRMKTNFGFETLDFEVGYTPVMKDDMSVRLFAGIRGLHFVNNVETGSGFNVSGNFTGSGFFDGQNNEGFAFASGFESFNLDFDNALKSEFFGAGPRIGAQFSQRFAGTPFGISGVVSATAAFGRQTDSFKHTTSENISGFFSAGSGNPQTTGWSTGASFSTGFTSTYSSTQSENKWVFDVQAKAGVDFYLDDSSKLTVGYQAEQLTNIGPIGGDTESKLVHGPVISLSGTF